MNIGDFSNISDYDSDASDSINPDNKIPTPPDNKKRNTVKPPHFS